MPTLPELTQLQGPQSYGLRDLAAPAPLRVPTGGFPGMLAAPLDMRPEDQSDIYRGLAQLGVDLSTIPMIPHNLLEANRLRGEGDDFGAGLHTLAAVPIIGGPAKVAAKGVQTALGAFPTTTPGRIANMTRDQGGYSVNVPSGVVPETGLFAGTYRNTDKRNTVLTGLPSRADVKAFFAKNSKVLQKPEKFFGTWFNQADGKTYLDVSHRFEPDEVRKATKFAERTGQLKIFNRETFGELPVGNWDAFIKSPEFRDRMDTVAAAGRAYLSQHPAKEWWDMRGTSFERIYGPENMRQTAGFTAATAPNAAPRENLQTMSEYMRRYIRGEPTIQPDFRIPEGSFERNPGAQLGMEAGRVANLEKAARGDVDALRLDKVRNEAQAMMGDPTAVVLDRHWARLGEDPDRGIFVSAEEGVIRGPAYKKMKTQVTEAARAAGRDPRDYSADAWTGIRETIKNTGELFGTKYRASAISGESKSYADHLDDLVRDKATQLGIEPAELESRLRLGDADLLSFVLAAPAGAAIWTALGGQAPPASDGTATQVY